MGLIGRHTRMRIDDVLGVSFAEDGEKIGGRNRLRAHLCGLPRPIQRAQSPALPAHVLQGVYRGTGRQIAREKRGRLPEMPRALRPTHWRGVGVPVELHSKEPRGVAGGS